MIPISGSAYTYAYATLGELVAWIIGWDLILEYAVGNVAVAIAWSDYFTSLLRVVRHRDPVLALPQLPRRDPFRIPEQLDELPLLFGHRIAINVPGIVIVAAITWVLVHRHQGERPRQQRDGRAQARGARPVRRRRRDVYIDPGELAALRPQRLDGHPPGRGHRVLRLHRLRRRLHRRRGDQGPAAQHAARHPGLARHLHGHLRDRRRGRHRHRALHRSSRAPIPWPAPSRSPGCSGARPSSRSARSSRCRRCCSSSSSASPASSSR